jgi:RNAse (barnase) inhibitor barstar
MAAFPDDLYFLHDRLDWKIFQNGWSSLYHKTEILEKDLDWFTNAGFRAIFIDCSAWSSHGAMHDDLQKALSFPGFYGKNLDAFNDCLTDIEIPGEGLVVVLRSFDLVEKETAYSIVDIFAQNSRHHILFGRKLLLLLQVTTPTFQLPAVGACPVFWNGAEFFTKR